MGIFNRGEKAETGPPVYGGIDGLRSADPVELAVVVFLEVFTGEEQAHHRPEAVLGALQRLSGHDEVPSSAIRGILTKPGARYSLDAILLQCVLVWERGLVAGRLSRGSEANHHIVLLPQGRRVQQDSDPAGLLRRSLTGQTAP